MSSTDNNDNIVEFPTEENDDGITQLNDKSEHERFSAGKANITRIMKKISSDEKEKKFSAPSLIIIIVLLLLLVYVVADLSSGGFLYTIHGKVSSAVYGSLAEKFDVSIQGETVYDFSEYNNGYSILMENGITYINSSGKVTGSQQITYSAPEMESNGSRIIIFDQGNNLYSIHQNGSMSTQLQLENRIVDADISERSNYAIAARNEKAGTMLYGFDGKGKVIYQWNCPDGYISDVTINDAGGKAVASVIDAKNAVLCSSVYILDFEYDSAYAVFEYNDETVLSTKFITNKRILVITDKRVYLISGKEQEIIYEYGSADIRYCDSGEKFTAIITKDYSHDDFYTLSVFGISGKLRYTVNLSGKVRGVSVSDKSIAVLFSDKTETYSKYGNLVGGNYDINYFDDIVINGNYVYLLSSDSVKKYPAYGSVSAEDNIAEDVSADNGG